MNWKAPLFFVARLVYAIFIVMAAVYCVLAFIPFTYQQVVVGGLLPWLTNAVRFHPYLNVIALIILVPTLLPDLNEQRSRILTIVVLGANAAGAIALFAFPLLTTLKNDGTSLLWSVVMLAPLLLVGVCDWQASGTAVKWRTRDDGEEGRLFQSALSAALFCVPLYAVVLLLHGTVTHSVHLPARQWLWSLLWSLLSQMLVFMGVFLLLSLAAALSSAMRRRRRTELALVAVAATVVLWFVLRALVFPPLSFRGWRAEGIALAFGVAITSFFIGSAASLCRFSNGTAESGLELLFWPLHFLRDRGLLWRIPFFVGLAGVTYWLATAVVSLDWAYLLQQLVVVLVWILSFAAFYTIAPVHEHRSETPLYVAAGVVLVAYAGLQLAQPRHRASMPSENAALVDEYANYDISFRLSDTLLSGTAQANSSDQETAAFYTFLAENTDVARSRQIAPVDINLVDKFQPAGGARPNVFVFVIDSLRRDYLGAYNPAITFTPNFDSFARDSVVMQNAFTHYGGTGLSEPSIWVGGMMLHKQYITPFAPMDTLRKFVVGEGYDAYVSKDTILQSVLGPSPEIHELDADIGTMNYELCKTLNEVTRHLPAPGAPPVFVYTQPQNIHVSVIDRQNRSVVPGATIPSGFDPPYASRVAQMDGCFGSFVAALKKGGLYDNSVIIVTADHGDSLGEHGRWGHAYTLFPEVVRVPLLIHLPPAMKAQLTYDPTDIAFLTDISPTLYYLLGEKPINDPMLGRPLFTHDLAEQEAYARDSYLVVSSYAPVYGVLDRNGRTLYIADGVNYRDYLYDLNAAPLGVPKPVTDDVRREGQARIRKLVLQIAKFYHL